MQKLEILKSVAVGNFTIGLVKQSEALVFSTKSTDINGGGVMLAYFDPLHDKMMYATCRQLFDMACEEDKTAEYLIQNYCIVLMMVRGCCIADAEYVRNISKAVEAMVIRVKGETAKAGEQLGIKEETEEEALAKMKEDEEIANIK